MAINLTSRSQRQPVHGILLDVAETLFSLASLHTMFEGCGLDAQLVPLWFARVLRDGFALAAAGDYRRFTDVATSNFTALDPQRLGGTEAGMLLDCLQALEPYPDVERGLQLMRDAGVRVMTLTNGEAALCEALFARAGLHGMVDGFLSADTVRRWRPAPEPYTYAVAQIGWPPSNVAFIAARAWDVHGARRAGLQSALVVRPCAADLQPAAPIFSAAHVTGDDLPAVVEQLLSAK